MNAIRSFFDIEELKQAFKKVNAAKTNCWKCLKN
jgi:hypothetical protein